MANKTIPDLPAAGALAGTEVIETVQAGVSVKTTAQDIANLGAGGLILTEISLSSAQLLAIHDTAVEVIPAPGSGKFIVPVCVSAKYTFNGSDYTSGGSGFDFYYGADVANKLNGSSGNFIGGIVVGVGTDIVDFSLPSNGSGGEASTLANKPLVLWASSSNFVGGNGTMKVQVLYYVIPIA